MRYPAILACSFSFLALIFSDILIAADSGTKFGFLPDSVCFFTCSIFSTISEIVSNKDSGDDIKPVSSSSSESESSLSSSISMLAYFEKREKRVSSSSGSSTFVIIKIRQSGETGIAAH